MAKKIILADVEYEVLKKVLRAVPPAKAPGLNGAELYFYRRVLTQILGVDYSFPKTDDGMAEEPEWGMHPEGEFDPPYIYSEPSSPDLSEWDLEPPLW